MGAGGWLGEGGCVPVNKGYQTVVHQLTPFLV